MRITYGPWGETLAELADAARARRGGRRRGRLGARAAPQRDRHRGGGRRRRPRTAGVGTAIALAFTRSPMVTALEALDLDELSGGRFVLGLGTGVQRLNEDWHNAQLGQAGRPPARDGPQHPRVLGRAAPPASRSTSTGEHEPMRIRGYQRPYPVQRDRRSRSTSPAMGPAMTRLAGEIADGWITPRALLAGATSRERILPEIDAGSRATAAATRADIDVVVSAVLLGRRRPGASARRRAAGMVGFYATRPHLRRLLRLPRPRRRRSSRSIDGLPRRRAAPATSPTRVPDRDGRRAHPRPAPATRSPSGSRRTTASPTPSSSPRPPTACPPHEIRAAQEEVIAVIAELTGGAVTRMKPLEDIRIIARRAVRRRPVRQRAPGRPRRRGHQDRGPARRRRRRALRPAVRRGRGLAVLRDLQPQQAQPLARPATPPRAARSSRTWSQVSDASTRNLRGDVPAKIRITLRRPQAPQPGDRLLLADRLRHDRPAAQGARLRLRPAGPGRLDGPDRRARRPADQVRPVDGRLLRRLRRRDLAAGRRPRRAPRRRRHGLRRQPLRHRDGDADLPGRPGTSTPASQPIRTRHSAHPSLVPFQAFEAKDGWLVVGCAKEKFWQRLTRRHRAPGVGRPTRGSRTFADRGPQPRRC